jgi:diguanylate cyclase (GGDEF)-like protein
MTAPGYRLLLVEDNEADARLIREALDEAVVKPGQVTHVHRLAEALAALAAETFDVILFDLSLPDGRGLNTIEQLRAKVPHVPLVVLTGVDDEGLALMSLQLGAQDYLVKGQIDRHLIARAVRYAIERHRMQATLQGLALIDELTGLYNRRGFLAFADQHLKLARRTARGLWLALAEVEGLKQINATFGRREGDRALLAAADILRRSFRDSDVVARRGGDEFSVLVLHASEASGAIITARLAQNVAEHNARREHPWELALRIGIAGFDGSAAITLDELMTAAENALYAGKPPRA